MFVGAHGRWRGAGGRRAVGEKELGVFLGGVLDGEDEIDAGSFGV
jgi:hypothetical protein